MKVTESTDMDKLEPDQLPRFTQKALENIASILNNGVLFSDNFNAKTLTFTFSAANIETAVIHGLGRVPTGYIQVGSSAALTVYDGASANTSSLLYLRASALGTGRVLVY